MTDLLVVVGDSLLDRDVIGSVERVCPDSPTVVLEEDTVISRPGGAALAATIAARAGSRVRLVTALGADPAGEELRALLEAEGVAVADVGLLGPTPEKVRLRSRSQSLLRLDRGGRAAKMRGDRHDEAFAGASGIVVSDYGRGMAELPWVRNLLTRSQAPVVWDPHPRGAVPVRGLRLVTPNLAELQVQIPPDRSALRVISTAAQQAAARWAAPVAVTLGERGALLVTDGSPPLAVPAVPAGGSDSCGAGDCFAVTAARRLAGGALTSEAVVAAVAEASRFVAAGGSAGLAGRGFAGRAGVAGAAGLAGDNDVAGRAGAAGAARPLVSSGPEQAAGLAAAIRSQGGTVVAAGGCFDLLHAGHVQLLTAARALGDLLIVCLNSDASVRRLKGAGRPVVPATDRAATLAALACVDAVAIFEEDTPLPLLEALRPDVFVKGGDYGAVQIPESAALARWGGQTLVVPYLSGRSTSALLHRVADV